MTDTLECGSSEFTDLRQVVTTSGLAKHGILTLHVGMHSFRVGGSNGSHICGMDRDGIKKMGQWSSDTFLVYMHNQIAEY